tara:strand:+ start:16708 stop:17775 length:1068 start_codon:yes stop_codon:yes gene_type:complete
MLSILNRSRWLYILIFFANLYGKTTTIKVYHVFASFGTETQELKNSIVMNYDNNGFLVDSTIYTHSLPLSEKYVYVLGPNEGLKLQRSYNREMVLSYRFNNNRTGKRTSTALYGKGDSLYWKEFLKYDDRGMLIKRIRYNPEKAINPEMMVSKEDPGEMIWGESYDYDSTGTILEHKEIYDNYILEITTYELDTLKLPHKREEYFDPSVIFRTIYFHDNQGQMTHEISLERLGKSLGSISFEYDVLGRRTKSTFYNSDGLIEETINKVYDDNNFKHYEYLADSTLKLISKKELLLDDMGRPYIEAVLDGEETLLEKNVYSYDANGLLRQMKQYDMVRRGQNDRKIPVRLQTYEYE